MPGLVTSLAHASAHGGGSISFALGDNRAAQIKVASFEWKPSIVGAGIARLNLAGEWPSHHDPRSLVLDVQGRIVSDSPSDYWTTRTALLESLLPPIDYDRSIFHHGTLTMTPPGQAAAYVLVNCTEADIPLSAESGRSTTYRISWVAHFGYWRAVAGGAVVFY